MVESQVEHRASASEEEQWTQRGKEGEKRFKKKKKKKKKKKLKKNLQLVACQK
jgi:hypothetical protein